MSAQSERSSATRIRPVSSASWLRAGLLQKGQLSDLVRDNISLISTPEDGVALSPEDEQLFTSLCRSRSSRTVRTICAVCIVCTLLWLPTDRLVYGSAQEELHPVRLARIAMLLAPLLVLLVVRKRLTQHAVPIFSVGLLVCCTVLGYQARLMGQLDEPWFHVLDVLYFLPMVLPLRLGPRVLMTLLIAGSLWIGFLLLSPQSLSSRYLPLSLSVQLNMYLMSIVFGHGVFLLNRQSFVQSRIIHRNAEALQIYNATLEKVVAERTADLRRLLAQVETAREEERTHMSRELHDELGQQLSALGYEITAMQKRHAISPAGMAEQIEDLSAQLEHARSTVRALLTELRPRVLDDLGLGAAVEWLVMRAEERGELRCRLAMKGEELPLPPEVATAAFRIAQESLTNVLRHAAASQVEVELSISAAELLLRVQDDGKGLQAEVPSRGSGVGLIGMRERASRLGGRVEVAARASGGTEVLCRLPLAGSGEGEKAAQVG